MARRIAGIDVGGTFTDLLAIDPTTNEVKLAKVPTTVVVPVGANSVSFVVGTAKVKRNVAVAITASNPDDKGELFDPAADKIYRHPTFYEIPEEVGHM